MAAPTKTTPPRVSRRARSAWPPEEVAIDLVTEFAHELRTPLAATLLWAKLLNSPTAPDPILLREGIEAITAAAHEQKALIDQLVIVAQLLAGRIQLDRTTVVIPAFARRVAAPWLTPARDRGIDFQPVIDPDAGTALVDATRLQQILHNLLDNALRFTPRAGRVVLELTRENHTLVWRVSDSGPGIAAQYLSTLFELHPRERPPANQASTGLRVGLFIARQLTALHGGTLTVASGGSTPGTVFTVRLPCATR